MKNKLLLLCALSTAVTLSSCQKAEVSVSIIPNPVSIEAAGRGAKLQDVPVFDCESMELQILGQTFVEVANGVKVPNISLAIDNTLEAEEYLLDSHKGKVVIKGGSQAGVWWGLQTLLQICYQTDGKTFPGLIIKDKPAFAYRGAHLDCGRHFFSIEEVKRFIDLVNMHKINIFHWHLTEDQGWRAEIKKLPKLTEIGSVRAETVVGHAGDSDTYDGTPYGGYYTQEQMKEIVSYAAARQMTVIPEIEIPGHASAALAAYPEFGCRGKGYKVQTTWGVFDEVFCIGNPGTVQLFKDVLDEICEIFPSEYIHIGGDEAPRNEWKKCPKCQALMKKMGYTSEAQLQSHIVNEIEQYLNQKGRKIIGWDEILEGGVSQSACVMSWRGTDGGIAAAKLGNDVIMAPNSYFYLDYYQTADPKANGEPFCIGGNLPLSKSYQFQPFAGLTDDQKAHIKGIQANVWTEYMADFDHVEFNALPRFAALAEISWSNDNRTDYTTFVERTRKSLLPVYDARGYHYAPYAFQNPPVE